MGPGPLFWRPWWIAENGTGNAALYNGAGVEKAVSVTIRRPIRPTRHPDRFADRARISNDNQTDFLLVPGKPAQFLFATVDGTLAEWNPGVGVAPGAAPPSTTAATVVKTSDGSAFTGLTRAFVNGKPYLFVENFNKGAIDIYDNAFHRVTPSPTQSDSAAPTRDGCFPRSLVPSKRSPVPVTITDREVLKQWLEAKRIAGIPENVVLYCARHRFSTDAMKGTGNVIAVLDTMGQAP